ncbi:MAG: esterase-like activity of phytase family protein, partial [Cyanobacteria bacterium CRU_2_1]|nr:esterase-like activity of phytase family protein [Cyanobacteria bacterium CRU_2_1]
GDNLGFESLTISASGSGSGEPFRVFTATESALAQDQEPTTFEQGAKNRLLHYLVEDGRSLLLSEHLYQLDPPPEGARFHGLCELLAIDQGGHFLSLERSFGTVFGAKIFQVTTGGATDTTNIDSFKGGVKGVQPIRKQLVSNLGLLDLPLDNLEGMTLGPRLADGSQSLLVVSDDNFAEKQVTQFLLFRLRKA